MPSEPDDLRSRHLRGQRRKVAGNRLDESAMKLDGETASVRWATYDDARKLISQSTNSGGRKRDLETLAAAYEAHALVR